MKTNYIIYKKHSGRTIKKKTKEKLAKKKYMNCTGLGGGGEGAQWGYHIIFLIFIFIVGPTIIIGPTTKPAR